MDDDQETDPRPISTASLVIANQQTIPQTKFEEAVLLSKKQFSEYFPSFPYAARKSLNRTTRGELVPVSNQELESKRNQYLSPQVSEDISNLSA